MDSRKNTKDKPHMISTKSIGPIFGIVFQRRYVFPKFVWVAWELSFNLSNLEGSEDRCWNLRNAQNTGF